MTSTKKLVLKYILHIFYSFCFWKNSNNAKVLINFSIKIDATSFAYALILGPKF